MEIDLSQLPPGLQQQMDALFREDFNRQVWAASQRQRLAADLLDRRRPRARDGLGEQTYAIDPVFDAFWRQCYGHDYTSARDLMKFLQRRNPEIGVRSRGSRIMVGWMPGSGSKRPVGMSREGREGGGG